MKPYTFHLISIVLLLASSWNNSADAQGKDTFPDYYSSYNHLHNPYIVKGFNPNFILPNKLSEYDDGRIVVDMFISKNGHVDGFNIKYVNLVNVTDTLQYYKFSGSHTKYADYPTDIAKLYFPIKHLIYNLRLVKTHNNLPKKKYIITLPLRVLPDTSITIQ